MEIFGHADGIAVDGGEALDGAEGPAAGGELALEGLPALGVGVEIDAPDGVEEVGEVRSTLLTAGGGLGSGVERGRRGGLGE